MKATFDDALAFLQAREGTSVYIEIGMRDPILENADFFPIKMHTELGTLRIGEDVMVGAGSPPFRLEPMIGTVSFWM